MNPTLHYNMHQAGHILVCKYDSSSPHCSGLESSAMVSVGRANCAIFLDASDILLCASTLEERFVHCPATCVTFDATT
jgi:hypothetical protein